MDAKINEQVKSLTSQIEEQRKIIATEQNNIINIDASISHINGMLVDMGITDFKIDKYGAHCIKGSCRRCTRIKEPADIH